MNITLWITSSLLTGALAAFFAEKHDKNRFIWFFLGATLNVFVVAFILVSWQRYKDRKRERAPT